MESEVCSPLQDLQDDFCPHWTSIFLRQAMANLVVLECHLWLNLTEIKEADKAPFLDSLVSLAGLFGPAIKGFAE